MNRFRFGLFLTFLSEAKTICPGVSFIEQQGKRFPFPAMKGGIVIDLTKDKDDSTIILCDVRIDCPSVA